MSNEKYLLLDNCCCEFDNIMSIKEKRCCDDINIIPNIYKNEKGVQRVPVLGNQLRGLFCDY
jgi:hypothetical protein